MTKLKALVKSLAPYWWVKKRHANHKFVQALQRLGQAEPPLVRTGQKVLVFSSIGVFADHMVVDTLLARELQRQGAEVIVVLCDGVMPACHVSDRYAYAGALGPNGRDDRQQRLCCACTGATEALRRDSGLRYTSYSVGIAHRRGGAAAPTPVDLADDVRAGVIRFAASSNPDVLKRLPPDVNLRYERAAGLALQAVEGLFEEHKPDTVIAHHGIYLPQGIVQRVARARGVIFYSWHFGYRKSTLIFSRGDTYHRELTAAQPAGFEEPLTEVERSRILDYLSSRMSGGQDWIHFNRKPQPFDRKGAKRGYFVCFTSVDWDAALHFPASVFSSQFDFLEKLVELFAQTPEYDLVIRIHPAEVTGFHPAALSAESFLRRRPVPPNVRIISASDKTSSYDLASHCIASIVYNTKLGIELPPMSIPVIVAGDCWIRGKGFSYDIEYPGDLAAYVRQGEALRVSPEQRERALQFAHYFYYRRCIDTPELISAGPKFQISVCPEGLKKVRSEGGGMSRIAQLVRAGCDVVVPGREAV